MRYPLSTDYKSRTGVPDKDARLKNAYIETRGDQSVVRRRPSGQGGIAVGTGTAQGGIGFNINGTDYFIGFWADTMQTYTGGGTSWNSGTAYAIGSRVSVNFEDYWPEQSNRDVYPPDNLSIDITTGLPSGRGIWKKTPVLPSTLTYGDCTYTTSNFGSSDIYVPAVGFPKITRTVSSWYNWTLTRISDGSIVNSGSSYFEQYYHLQAPYAQYTQYSGSVMLQADAIALATSWGISQPPSDSRVSFTGRSDVLTFDGSGNPLTASYSGTFIGLIK